MATEEQKNNQQTLNDLLKDYISGQLEAAEYTALVTSRTADLTDAIRKTVRQKREATELDKQLVSSVKKIADLTRSLEKPYQSVSDVQKDIIKNDKEIIKLENSLGALRSKLSETEIQNIENYKTAQQSVIDNEKLLGQLKSQLNAEELKAANEYFDFINANQEAINKENKLREQVDLSSFENKKTLIEELKAAELKANEEVFISKQEVNKAEEVARKAQLDFQAALAGTNEDAKRLAKEKLDIANSELNIAKEFNREYETIQFNKRIELSTAEKTLTNKEKELLAAQKLTEITAKELEDYEKVLEVRQDINIEAVKAASTTEKSLALSRDELEISQKQLTTDAQIAAQAEESLEVARTNAKFLADQEAKQKELVKIQGLYNISLGFAEGFLKKMGANSAVIALGLEEGKKAAKEMALAIKEGEVSFRGPFKGLQKQLAVFSAGVKGTFKGMGEGLKEALGLAGLATLIGKALGNIKKVILFPIKTAFSALLAPAKTIVSEIRGYFNEAFSYIRDNFFSIRGLVSTFKEGETLMKTLSLATEKVATDLGVSTASARQLNNQVARLSGEMGALPEKLAENMVALNQSFGTTQRFSDETVRSFNRLVERLGFSTEEAAELVKISKLQGETTDQTLQAYEDEVLALKNQYGIAISSKEIFQEISKVSSATRLTLIGQNKNIATAVVEAKKLGLELSKIEDISSSLLDFESSISKELEAELLIGRDLNLERARQAALQGDFATVAKEISKEAGSAAEFGKLNLLQQEGLAAAVGMTRDELAKVVETQALLEATGFEDMNAAQADFNKLVASGMKIEEAQAKFRQKYGNEALDTQLAQVAYAKQRELQERKLAETQMAMAQAMLPVAQAFIKLQLTLQKIRNIIVQEMRPFFNAFSGLIGDASKSMETGLYKYASLLGEKLNAVGLTLVQFFKTQGPNIKETFMSILDVFGSIYDLVGNIIKELFNIKGTSSVTDPLKNALQLVQNIAKDIVAYVKTIDAGSIAEKIKSIITGIGNFYQGLYNFVKGTITTIRDVVNYVKENPIKTLLGAGAVTGLALLLKRGSSRLLPMFVKNVDGPGGGGMFETLKNLISKPKSGTGLTGTNRIVNAIKGGFKGGGLGGALKGAQTASSRMPSSSLWNIGSRFLGRTGAQAAASTVTQAGQAAATAGRVASTTAQAGRAVTATAGIGRAALGGVGAIVGIAAEMALDHFASKARESAASIDEQIAASNNEADIKKLNAEKESKLNAARNLEIGASTAKWAGIGASVGMLFGPLGTAIGAGVGAVAGFTLGIIEANKQRAFELTETGKFQKELRETQLKAQKSREQLDLTFAKLELRKRSDQLKASLDIQQEFATKLKGIDLSVPMEKPTEAFKALAQTLLDTGQITEEQFKAAISGTISPLQLMKNATNNATDKLAKLYGVVAAAVEEEERKAREAAYTAAGTSEDIVKAQQEFVESTIEVIQFQSLDLFNKYGEELTGGVFDLTSTLKDFLANAEDEKAFRGELVSQFKDAGIAPDDISKALRRLDDRLKAGEIRNISLGTGQGVKELIALIGGELKAEANLVQAKASAAGSGAGITTGGRGVQATGFAQKIQVQIINEDNSSKFRRALGAARSLTGINEQVTEAEKDKKITTEELDNIITALTGLATTDSKALTALQQLANAFPKIQDGVIPSIQRVQDGSSISNNGPFTIQDSKGNLAITHPKDKLVVSPNVSYINDGATGKGGPVFPISEKFGALDVKVSPKGVMVQKINDAVSTSKEFSLVQKVQDAISPWEIFSDPIGAVKHYLLPVIVEESGHIIKSLFKSKALSAPLKAILKKTPIIGHAMHAATGAINISHLLHKEGVTKDKLDQEVGKAALTTVGGIGGGILGTMIVNILGNLATSGGMALSGPAGMVLSVLGGTVGGMLGEMFAGFVADKLGAKPVGSPIVSLFRQEYDQLHPPTLASPNLVHTAPKPKTPPQRVSDGSSSSKGPFTIMDRLGNIAVTHPKDGLVVSPNISYVNDGATGKGGPVFPISEKFGALDVKVSPKGVMVQKINDGVVAPSTYQEVLGSTSATNIISSNVITGLGVPGVTEENFKGQFTVATPSGLKNIVGSLFTMGKNKALSEFAYSGPSIAPSPHDSFVVEYSDGTIDKILNDGYLEFPKDPYTRLNLTKISASGNGLLALRRALNEIKPREVKNKDGVTITSYLADRYGIGFKQDRKSSGLVLDPGPINDLVPTFNTLQELFPYLAVTRESANYVTGAPGLKRTLGATRNDYDSQIQYARTNLAPNLLNNEVTNFIPADRGIREEALIKEGLEPFDFSKIKEVIENIKPKVPHTKDLWYNFRSEIAYSEKAWEIVRDSFVPQYVDRVLGFVKKYVSPEFYEKFEANIKPQTDSDYKFSFAKLFTEVKTGPASLPPAASLKTKETQYALGSAQETLDGISSSEIKIAQRVNDGSVSSKGPFTIMDRLGNIAVTHPKDGLVVSPNISYVNDGATGKGGPVFPISEKFGALDVKVSPKGVMVQKINDGVVAPSTYQEVLGSTSATNIISSNVITGLGVPGVTEENFKGQFTVATPSGLKNIVGSLFTMGKNKALSEFAYSGPSIAPSPHDSFVVEYSDGTIDKILNDGYLEFPKDPYTRLNLTKISASGNGLLALRRALNEIKPREVKNKDGVTITSYLADRYGIGFKQDRKSSGLVLDPGPINDLVPTFNTLQELFPYLAVTRESANYVTGAPGLKRTLGATRNDYDSQIQYARTNLAPNLLNNEVTNFIPADRGIREEALIKEGLEPFDFSKIKEVIENIKPKVPHTKDLWYNFRSEIAYSEKAWEIVRDSFVPQYVDRVLGFVKKYVSPEFYEKFEANIKPKTEKSFTFKNLFGNAELGPPGTKSGATIKTTQEEYAEGSIQKTLDGISTVQHLQETNQIQQVNDGFIGGIMEQTALLYDPIGYIKEKLTPVIAEELVPLIQHLFKKGSILNKAFKNLAKKIPYIGPLMDIGGEALNINKVLSSGQSRNQINTDIGNIAFGALGSIGGATLGGIAGSALGPIGTFVGSFAGGELGGFISEYLSKYLGGPNLGNLIVNNIPQLAEGGVVSKPTVALIGEAGPEAVVPLDQIAQESTQTSTTVIESDNSDLKKELELMRQLMSELIKELPSIANRPIRVELDGNRIGGILGNNAYRG